MEGGLHSPDGRSGLLGCPCSSSGLPVNTPLLENDQDGNKEKKIAGSEAGGGSATIIRSSSSRSTVKCPVCSKSFHSEKAMHGHMRCHPERGWKGIHPPPPPPSGTLSSSSSSQDSSIASIAVSSHRIPPPPPPPPPPGWLRTGRRGQNRIIHTTYSSPNPNISLSLEDDAIKTGGASWKEYMERGSSLLRPRKYKCKSCNNVFPTLQALTGNRSPTKMGSENEYRSSPTAAPEEEEGIALLASASGHANQVVVPKAHKCKICSKAFTTGQALGGHQTTHRNKSDAPPKQPQPVLFLEDAARQSGGSEAAVGFDLNQLPPMEEEQM